MKLWLITVGEPLPGLSAGSRLWRTGLLANVLVAKGHDVLWWTSSVDHFTKNYIVDSSGEKAAGNGLRLRFLHGRLYKQNVSWARLQNHREIAREFALTARQLAPPDLIVCSFPTIELSAESVRFGHDKRIPVFLDIRDLWPDEMYARIPIVVRPIARILLASLERLARNAVTGASGLLAISDGYLDWGLRLAGRPKSGLDRVFTHGYPDPLIEPPTAEQRKIVAALRERFEGRRIVWFAGTFVGSIDLGTVIETARALQGRNDIVFVLTGAGERQEEWQRQAMGLSNVTFTGWADRAELDAWARCAWVGLGAYKRGALMSLTNKIFEYLGYGLPVLLALPGEARDIIESADAGVFYEPGDPESLATVLTRLTNAPSDRDRMARNARELFSRRFAAEVVYEEMAEHLLSVAARPMVSQ